MEPVLLIVLGHFIAAVLFYLNHRFIFHGRLGNLKFLKPWKKVHTMHHKYDYTSQWKKYALIPWWGWVGLSSICFVIGFLTDPLFGVGIFSYILSYEIIHYYLHKYPKKKNLLNQFHHYHHRKEPKKNFATFWIFIDRMFKTHKGGKAK